MLNANNLVVRSFKGGRWPTVFPEAELHPTLTLTLTPTPTLTLTLTLTLPGAAVREDPRDHQRQGALDPLELRHRLGTRTTSRDTPSHYTCLPTWEAAVWFCIVRYSQLLVGISYLSLIFR